MAVVGAAVAVAQPGPQLPHHHQQPAVVWRTGAMAALAIWLSPRGRLAARWVLQRRHLESYFFRNNVWKPFQRQNIFLFTTETLSFCGILSICSIDIGEGRVLKETV